MSMDFIEESLSRKRDIPFFLFCAGGGRMGTTAAEAAKALGASVVVADPAPHCLARGRADVVLERISEVDPELGGRIQLLPADAAASLLELMRQCPPHLIVPATEGHFAAKLAVAHLGRKEVKVAPCTTLLRRVAAALPTEVVLLVDEKNAVLVTSYMPSGIMCKEDCEQPILCPVLGRKNERPMHELVREKLSREAGRSTVLITTDLGGVGALKAAEVQSMLAQLDPLVKGDSYALATSCRCHSIANIFEIV
jgi:hypothetical protein